LREEADKIRSEIVSELSLQVDQEGQAWLKDQWWFVVTLAEAYFGLGLTNERYFAAASQWLQRATTLPDVADWEFESTARQLITLLSIRHEDLDWAESLWKSKAFTVLGPLLLGKEVGLRATLNGKVGLSLSGGGFRAALFHVGLLAKLAELDMLRNVEVISCVSAGSIIGAHYYLELRELLQSKRDAEITREDYIDVVMRVEHRFLQAVQSNIRTRLGAEILTNLKTVFLPNYTRTERIGELLEKTIYSKVGNREDDGALRLEELDILPPDEDPSTFIPAEANWRRAAKVPALVINATTLNTGHNWQFTTSWMGEPAASINSEIDRAPRLRQVRYTDAPKGYKGFLLRRAVAASTCTLGLMEPVTLKNLYPGMTVRLVDGVFQGPQAVGPLLQRDCDVLLVSDASGQMHAQENPGQGVLDVTVRSTHMLFGHLRACHYESLESRLRSSLLRGLMFLHLKKELDAKTLFAEADDAIVMLDDSRTSSPTEVTSYGVLKEVQKRLAEIRTDIDAFSDAEAYALMMSGYLMTAQEFVTGIKGYPVPSETRPPWRFLAIEEPMKTVGNKQLIRLLDAAGRQLFKFWAISPTLRAVTLILGYVSAVVFMLALAFLYFFVFDTSAALSNGGLFFPPHSFPFTSVCFTFLTLFAYLACLVITKRKTPSQIIVGIVMSTIGFLFARLTLHILDPWYLAKGRIGNVHTPDRRNESTDDDTTWLNSFLKSISPSRPIGYLSQKADITGSVKSIGRIVDHARAVEAIARLFEYQGYETVPYPRDEKINPLQLSLDIYARNRKTQIFTSVRTPDGSPSRVTWTAPSKLNAACSALEDVDEGDAPPIEARLVLVGTLPDNKLQKYVEKARTKGLRIHVVAISEDETDAITRAQPGDPLFERAIEKLQIASSIGGRPSFGMRSLKGRSG
jgi:predicted acylesterase/phospholipase RssA